MTARSGKLEALSKVLHSKKIEPHEIFLQLAEEIHRLAEHGLYYTQGHDLRGWQMDPTTDFKKYVPDLYCSAVVHFTTHKLRAARYTPAIMMNGG